MITFNQDHAEAEARSNLIAASHPRYEVFEDEVVATEPWGKTVVGFDLDTGQNVAVSIVDPNAFATEEEADRFWRQVARRASVEHPGLLPICEVDQQRNWIITNAARIGWLPDVQRRSNDASKRVGRDLRSLVGGLDALHNVSLVAGEWRPEEFCVAEDGKAQLRCLAPNSHVTWSRKQAREANPFVAPERNGVDDDTRPTVQTDLYGIGVGVLFGLVGGDLTNAMKKGLFRRSASSGEWIAAKKLILGESNDVASIIDRLVAKKPAARYGQTSSVLADLGGEEEPSIDTVETSPSRRQSVVMQRSPFADDLANEHFKPINPVVVDNETRIEKLLSPERIYEGVKHPAVIAGLLAIVAAFIVLTRSTSAPLPRHRVAIQIQDTNEAPLTEASLTVRNTAGINKTYSLGQDAAFDLRLPQGSYELSVTKSGYQKCEKGIEVTEDTAEPVLLVMREEVVVPPASDITISPRTIDSHDSDIEARFEFIEVTDQLDRRGKPVERVLAANDYEFCVDTLMPGDELTLLVRATGYVDERLQVRYDEFPVTMSPVLRRAPRWLTIQVDQQNTQLWADDEEIAGDLKQASKRGDTYRLQVPFAKRSIAVEVMSDGFQKAFAAIPIQPGSGDVFHRLELDPVPPPPAYPLRKIEAATAGTRIYVNGKLLGTTRAETGLPAGLHQVVLKRPDGEQREYEVRFSELLSQVAFDF